MAGRSIRLFLVDGTATGTRTAELGLSTIKALVIPRASLAAAMQRSEPQKTGVYILIGQDSDLPSLKRKYIGEGDTIINRISVHNKDPGKDFWDEVVLFVSKDENLNKAHGRYIEARLIALAKAAKRSIVVNGTEPSEQGKLSEPDQVEMEEFIAQARLLLGTLGYDIFEPVKDSYSIQPARPEKSSTPENTILEFIANGVNFSASMRLDKNSGQFVVTEGSKARKSETASLQPTYKNLRLQLIQNGVLKEFDELTYEFSQDYAFSASTPAAQVVCASSANGRTFWKLDDGRTFAEWEDVQLPKDVN